MTAAHRSAHPAHWVVVGAGSAGCVVAARLAEDGTRRVTVLEAGPDLVPGAVPPAIDGADFLAALALPGRVHDGLTARRHRSGELVPYAQGRGVGGSSAINSMVALRGDPAQYRGWGWDDVDAAWERVRLPVEIAPDGELGAVDRALLAAAPDAAPAPLTRAGGRRVTAAEAYLWPARSLPNVVVRPQTPVDRVVFEGRRASGVALADGSEIAADRIVLAAGAINSPAILLRSGVDTPGVGVGLQDHPAASITLVLREPDATPLAIGAVLHRDGFQVLPMNHLGAAPGAAGLGALLVALMAPRGAAGRVGIGSDDPAASPTVEFGLLDDARDLRALRRGVRLALRLLRHDAFGAIVERAVIDEHGTDVAALADDRTLDRWMRSQRGEYLHASSSCRMGGAVDGDGALVGYRALHVCDASVFPAIPDVNTHLPTVMLAERLVARWTAP